MNKPKIKNKIFVVKNGDGTYSTIHMTFCNGNTINRQVWNGLSFKEAHSIKKELENLYE